MGGPVSIEHWESDPHHQDDRCDHCGSLARVVRVTTESSPHATPRMLRLCPACLHAHSTHAPLLGSVKRLYPRLWKQFAQELCEVCGAPAEDGVFHSVTMVHGRSKHLPAPPPQFYCKRCM